MVSGVDIVDGTPVLDIKPYIPIYDAPQHSVQETSTHYGSLEASATCNSTNPETKSSIIEAVDSSLWHKALLPKLEVAFTKRAERDIQYLQETEDSSQQFIMERHCLRDAITEVLREDPRSTYRRKKCCDRLYYFVLDDCHITTWFDYSCEPALVEVLRVKPMNMVKDLMQSTSAEDV